MIREYSNTVLAAGLRAQDAHDAMLARHPGFCGGCAEAVERNDVHHHTADADAGCDCKHCPECEGVVGDDDCGTCNATGQTDGVLRYRACLRCKKAPRTGGSRLCVDCEAEEDAADERDDGPLTPASVGV